MQISIFYSVKEAARAKGLVVIIDVFRAFTTACFVFVNGAERIICVGNIDIAYELKKKNPDYVLMGERNGFIQAGFDYGNSPFQIRGVDFRGKTVVHTTSRGTQGLTAANNAAQLITGSFVNAGAIIRYIRSQEPKQLSLVCTGSGNEHILDEDALCAEYIKNALLDKPNDFRAVISRLKSAGFADYFFDPTIKSHPLEDFELCMSLDRFDFVLQAEPQGNSLVYLEKLQIL